MMMMMMMMVVIIIIMTIRTRGLWQLYQRCAQLASRLRLDKETVWNSGKGCSGRKNYTSRVSKNSDIWEEKAALDTGCKNLNVNEK
jgi:hypothetical protein